MRANKVLKIEFQNQNADFFWISRLAVLVNSFQESPEVVGIILKNVSLREGVLNCAGNENKKEESFECCKRCQAALSPRGQESLN